MRSYFPMLLSCVLASLSSVGCESSDCSDELRGYGIRVERDLPVPFAEVTSLQFTACVNGTCKDGAPSTTPSSDALLQGELTANADGSTHLNGSIQIFEGPESTPVALTVKKADAVVLQVDGTVKWREADDQACHEQPVESSL